MKLFVQWEPLLPHVMFSNFERVLKGEHQLPDYPTVQDALDVLSLIHISEPTRPY